ncbi:MAG: hypothetical protein K8W52_33115 [Deltaproteobacteria bacterium]|nr:hypothetical protein [Deltaproteobacteria bacterium]
MSALACALAAACLPSVNGNAPPECHVTTDCPLPGQVCDEGVCWGGLPSGGQWAAQIGPPSDRQSELVVTEVPELTIPDDGGFGEVIVQAPVRISGRVHFDCTNGAPSSCDPDVTVAAALTITRPSRIAGGPGFVGTTTSVPDASGDSFAFYVPRLSLTDDPYTITITPLDVANAGATGPTPAELAPPVTIQVAASDTVQGLDVVLGKGVLRKVSGKVVDATGAKLPGVRVFAEGRFDAARPLERVSSVGVTNADGAYTIYIAESAFPVVDLVAHPTDYPALTLRLTDIAADQPTQSAHDLRLPGLGVPIAVSVPITGRTGAGDSTAIAGAVVTLTTTIHDSLDPNLTTSFLVSGATDATGQATVSVLPGSTILRDYLVGVQPPAESEFATLYDRTIQIGPGGGVLGKIELAHRVAVTGTLLDANGDPAQGVVIQAEPAQRLALTLDADAQAQLKTQQRPLATTLADGSFFVWVDPELVGKLASYDLTCDPPEGARLPRWAFRDVGVASLVANVDLGGLVLPPGRHVRGIVTDTYGTPVPGAELRLFEIVNDPSLCGLGRLPADCILPAALRARDRSDELGVVELVVPDSH